MLRITKLKVLLIGKSHLTESLILSLLHNGTGVFKGCQYFCLPRARVLWFLYLSLTIVVAQTILALLYRDLDCRTTEH